MNNKYKYLAKNTLLFLIASFIPKILSFIMVPLYTRCLSTSDYGTADLLTNTAQLLMPLLTLQIQDAVLRFAMDRSYNQNDVFSIAFRITNIGCLLLLSGVIILKVFCVLNWPDSYFLYLIVYFFVGSLSNLFSYFGRAIDKIGILTISSILSTLISISLNIVFLVVLKWGLSGYLLANTIGIGISDLFIFVVARMYKYINMHKVSRVVQKEMIVFSVPMIVSALSWWINNASDKYILTFFCGLSVVGVYSVASKIPTILTTLGAVISKAFSISAIKDFDENDTDGFLGNSYVAISYGMTLGCSLLIICNLFLSKVLFSNGFFIAWKYVPPLLISVLMNQLSLSCENFFIAIKKTKIISVTALVAAGLNTALNFIMIPLFKAYGAAIATAIGFTAEWAIRYFRLKNVIHIKNNIKKELFSYSLLIIQMGIAFWGNRFFSFQVLIFVILILIYYKELKVLTKKLMNLMRSFIIRK